ncbi:SDR family oxidoreductase [Sinirhodobacter populi]|uniref:SDR family oxidoreductase n=1 Tax=Paenirhodobacter populi TaxID=2306993 RepID=A0A443J9F8_9RHOB|nr:SDR family oxidoreductase [Sinirhodobacter populi]RWR17151.1 SDR family oxidoreductase [Sinirhodobacter populi]
MGNCVEGLSIIVTGSGRGIGRAMAAGLAAAGANLTIADIDQAAAEATAADILAMGGRATAVGVDVTDRVAVRRMIAHSVAEYGRLDVVFNNAGIAQVRRFGDITEADWRRMMDVNGLGVLIGIQESAVQFIAQGGGGKIVNTASVAGKRGSEALGHYSASKFAVIGLTQAAAQSYAAHRITVNSICPGIVATDMWDAIGKGFRNEGMTTRDDAAFEQALTGVTLGRPSTPEDLVGVAIFLASPGSDYMTGQSLVIDGGMVFS